MPQPAFGGAVPGPVPVATDAALPAKDSDVEAANWRDLDNLGDLETLTPRERLVRVMEKSGWVQAKAARLLGLTPRQVGYALRKHNIEIKRL